ncbi:MAG: VC0807 family protein [Bdellovibrionota bacterium]|jgi:hypothetical protein|nr:VC0807 family protein [Bdellovibrionota bacterium]
MDHNPSPNFEKETIEKGSESAKKRENPLLNLGFNLIIPTVIMMKFSGDQHLGQVYGLVTALAFPLLYGLYDLLGAGKVNVFSLLGLLSILLTGGIGLMEVDKTWMIVKETGFPLVLGCFVFISEKTQKPLIRQILDQVIDLEKIQEVYNENGIGGRFKERMRKSTYLLGSTFFISALLNFLLAYTILEGQPGSEEFVASLGKMTGLSFPVIALPMMIMVGFILFNLFNGIKKETNAEIETFFRQ